MCPWWCGLEWRRDWDGFGGLTIYNQIAAARLDRIMELARSHHSTSSSSCRTTAWTSSHVDMQWADSPSNAVTRGPRRSDADFFSNEEAWATHAKRLRYTVARWGWHSHLAAWVLSSEMEFTGAWWEEAGNNASRMRTVRTTQAWVKRSLEWFAANDLVSGRPVTIHFIAIPGRVRSFSWKLPGLGFSNSNAYTGFQTLGRLGGEKAGLGNALLIYLNQHFPPWTLGRPTLIGEWGGHWERTLPPSSRPSCTPGSGCRWCCPTPAIPASGGGCGRTPPDAGAITRRSPPSSPARTAAASPFRPYRPPVFAERQHTAAVIRHEVRDRAPLLLPGCPACRTISPSPARRMPGARASAISTRRESSAWHCERWDCAKGTVVAAYDLIADAHGVVKLPLGVPSIRMPPSRCTAPPPRRTSAASPGRRRRPGAGALGAALAVRPQ